jgi:hypothetical protein
MTNVSRDYQREQDALGELLESNSESSPPSTVQKRPL